MIDALNETASTAQASGVSLQKVEGYITSIGVATGKEGSEVGNSVRSMLAKIYKPKAQDTLEKEAGVSVKDEMGQYKSAGVVLDELNEKWDTLTYTQKVNLAQQVGGIQRYNDFLSLMDNYQMSLDATITAENSQGSAMKENEILMETTQAKIEILKASLQEMATEVISSDLVKGTVEGLTTLVNTFGNLSMVVGVASTAFLLFKGKAIAGLVTDLFAITAGETATTVATIGLTSAVNKMKLAFMSNPLGMIAVAITSVIGLFSYLHSKVEETRESVKNMSKDLSDELNSVRDSQKNNDTLSSLIKQQEELDEKVKSSVGNNSELKKAKEDLFAVEKKIADLLPSSVTGYDNENNKISDSIELNKQLLEVKKAQAEADLRKNVSKTDSRVDEATTQYDNAIKKLKEYQKRREDIQARITDLNSKDNSEEIVAEKTYEEESLKGLANLENVQKSYVADSVAGLLQANATYKEFNDTIGSTTGEHKELIDMTKYSINAINSESNSAKDATNSTKQLDESVTQLGDDTDSTADSTETLAETLATTYKDALSSQKDAVDLQSQLNEAGKLTPEIIQSALELYPDMGASVFDVASMQEYLNNKIEEQKEIQKQTYADMLANDSEFFNSKIKNSETYSNFQEEVLNILSQMNNDYYNSNADGMKTELENAETLAQSRLAIDNKVIDALTSAWKQYYTALAEATKMDITATDGSPLYDNAYDEHGNIKDEYKSLYEAHAKQVALASQLEKAKNSLSSNVGGIAMPSFSSADFSTGSSSSSSSSEKDYTVDNLESMTESFYNLNNAIDDVKNAEESLSKQIENAYGKDKLNLIQARIQKLQEEKDLTQKLINDYGTEIWNKRVELDSKVRSMGATIDFDTSGNVTNRNELLEALRQSVNAMQSYDDASKEAKQTAQENVKEIESLISSYDDLQNGLDSTTSSYEDLSSAIRESYRTMADEVVDGESKIGEIIKSAWEKKLDTVTKYSDQLKDKINSTYEENTYQDDKAKAEKELLDIKQAMNEAVKSGDKELFNTLKKQYQDQQESINSMIKEKEKDNVLDAIDKDTQKFQDAMDDALKPENLTKSITTALQEGYINVAGSIQTTQDAMTEFLKDGTTGTETLTLAMDEYAKSLSNAVEMYSKLGDINSNIGIVTTYTPSNAVNDANANWSTIVTQNSSTKSVSVPININIDSVTGVDDLKTQLNDWANTIYRTIDYQLGLT